MMFKYPNSYFKNDLMAGLVVFLVAIPLCLGVALASGAPLFSGIIAGIIGGIIVGSISQSSVSVSGPAAGMVAVVLGTISQLGGFQAFLLALTFAGVLQIVIGSIRAGFIADYIPSNVIQGLLCAIGILIIIKQLPLAFTHPGHPGELMGELLIAAKTFDIKGLIYCCQHINAGATIITLLSLFLLISFDKIENGTLKAIPAPVLVVLMGILINEMFIYTMPALMQDSAKLVNIPVHNTFQGFFSQFQTPDWKSWNNPNIYLSGFFIAILASLETLLNLEAAEKLDKNRRYCSRNRELVAQGFGNLLSGLLGGIAITSVVVRSSVNIQAGARSKLATIIHGLFILIVVSLFPDWLNKIPLASLAAILIFVGYKLTKISIYQDMYEQGAERFIPFIVTVVAIVFTNLLAGILIGLSVSFFFILKANSELRLDIIRERHPIGLVNRIILPQQVSFLKKASLIAELNAIPKQSQLVIDARYSQYIDKDILELIKEFKERRAVDKKIALNLIGFKKRYNIHDHIDFINVTTYDVQSALTPDEVLRILKEGNHRFINDQRIHRNLLVDLKETSKHQHPIAVILSCIDSRVPVETIFDMGLGDLFSVRVAGNIINPDVIASIEFACLSGAKLILILGHTGCGAIKAACEQHSQEPHSYLPQLLEKIKPAVDAEEAKEHGKHCDSEEFLLNVSKTNINNSLANLLNASVTIQNLLQEKKIDLIAAIYDIKNGVVNFEN